jgi:Flp pilus assembly protein TadG
MGRMLARLGADQRGGAGVVFALMATMILVPMVFIGANVSVAMGQKAKLQDSLDAATLFVARSKITDEDELAAMGERALKANLELIGGEQAKLLEASFVLVEDDDGERIVGTAKVQPWVPVTWCKVHSKDAWCFTSRAISATTEVVRAIDKIEVALVLDNTGSMNNETPTRISILRTEAAKLVDSLAAIGEGDVKISLVPFSNTVRVVENVDLDNYNTTTQTAPGLPSWIDPVSRSMGGNSCGGNTNGNNGGAYNMFDCAADRFALMKAIGEDWKGCVESRQDDYDISEEDDGTWKSRFVPYFWPDQGDAVPAGDSKRNNYLKDVDPSAGTSGNDNQKKKALLTEQRRTAKYTLTGWHSNRKGKTFALNSGFGGPYYYGPNAGCELEPLIRLTTDTDKIKTAIGKMNAIGQTHIPIGLVWGWHTLSPTSVGPYGDGAAYGAQDTKKFIILMTDGDNTNYSPLETGIQNTYNDSYYGGYGLVWQKILKGMDEGDSFTKRTEIMDDRLIELCDEIKDKGIIIYTIGVVASANSQAKLTSCASELKGKKLYYDVSKTSDLGPVFQKIAGQISQMRIAH